ncbi:MAG: amidohydrolase family protein, partial [Firmicutes bacterium]|nr:amidohydrolase family protein [Bacillota bacterium]
PAIDAHNHLGKTEANLETVAKEYVRAMDECNVEAVVDLDGGWGERLSRRLDIFNRFPGRFYVFANINWEAVDEPDFPDLAVRQLEDSVRRGAVGLKISKSLGLRVKTKDGKYLPVDTPKLDPVWARCGELGIPVLIHTGDPQAFFTPLDRHNERLLELAERPDWLFVGDEYYSKEELLAQRNRVIERHPDTVFIGAHVANLPEDLDQVEQWLDKYPNLYIDLSARLSELGRQPYRTREFLIKHADRIIFGTDGNAMGQPIDRMYRLHWRFFETYDEYFDITESHKLQGYWRVYGIKLPDSVLERMYRLNFLSLVG